MFAGGGIGLGPGEGISEKNVAFAVGEEVVRFGSGGDAEGVGVVMEGAVVEFGEVADAALNAGTHGDGPEDAMLAELDVAFFGGGAEALDVFFGGAGEEEQFVEVALAGQLGFAQREAGILHQFAWRERL